MKTFLSITFALFCLILNSSVAVETKLSDEIEILSKVLKECSTDNLFVLDMYFHKKIFIERHTAAELVVNNWDKLNEGLLKNVFPGYSKNDKSDTIKESYCRTKITEEDLSSKDNLTSYFNGYLIKVDDAWKIRKVEGNEVAYNKVDGNNVMDLVEFFYAFGPHALGNSNSKSVGFLTDLYNRRKLLALIKTKYQLGEATKETGMSAFEEEFWNEYNLGSDLIQQVADLKYIFDNFQVDGDELYLGADGHKIVVYEDLGNVSIASVFEKHLGSFDVYAYYTNGMREELNKEGVMKELVKGMELKKLYENGEKDLVEGETAAVEESTGVNGESEEVDVTSVVSMKGNFPTLF